MRQLYYEEEILVIYSPLSILPVYFASLEETKNVLVVSLFQSLNVALCFKRWFIITVLSCSDIRYRKLTAWLPKSMS